jgi:hypothetical protein
MNFQNLGNKVIDDQGNVKTFSSGQDARLYYLDFEGNTKKYLLEGEAAGGGELPENLVTSVNGQTGDVTLDIPEVPKNIVNSINGQTGDVNINIPEIPGNIVNSINGETGDVTLEFPELPANIVNTFNGLSGEIEWPKYVVETQNAHSLVIAFNAKLYFGEIHYLANPLVYLGVTFPSVDEYNVQYMKDKYVIVRTADTFEGVTVQFQQTNTTSYPEWITNKEFVMEPNKVYLIGCNYPLATIIELKNVK